MDVLLIDDNPLMQQVITRFLMSLGYTVAVFARGDDALAAAPHALPRLMIIDLNLPDAAGEEICAALHQLPGWSAIPAIAMSGLERAAALALIQPEFAAYLEKPFDLDELEALVTRHMLPVRQRSVGA